VLGVKYVIDFCLSKEIRFDLKSRMENLEPVWASKASCNQRAGELLEHVHDLAANLLD
jgi:HrpA-like RNA helicase